MARLIFPNSKYFLLTGESLSSQIPQLTRTRHLTAVLLQTEPYL